ncbi:MAG: tetratricopeptide repeat protein [Gammaproteobacteria bacterium]|nr:tetratricopeptide repeat protein [Gammaproteobacteria bacterium]NNM01667.1 tetratricopeptide repeat protein [Gammaproteobacteria bacterium]
MRISLSGCALLAGLALSLPVAAQQACGDVFSSGGIGPFDYRDYRNKRMLRTVEKHHFLKHREGRMAISGASDLEYSKAKGKSAGLGNNLDYTLRAFPNHTHALYAMAMFQMKRGTGPNYKTIECYFERANKFVPDDPGVKHIRGIYYHRRGEYANAVKWLDAALEIAPNNGELAYNAGLAHLELKDYDRALELAHEAIRLGYTLSGLKRRLTSVGIWRDPEPAAMGSEVASGTP